MTNKEFQEKLEKMYAEHPIIAGSAKKTFNVLVHLLRQDSIDYNISIPPYKMEWDGCASALLRNASFL
jgi:hypothetical protein